MLFLFALLSLALQPAVAQESALVQQYRLKTQEYRVAQEKSNLELTQYRNLQTLAAQENAVIAVRELLLSRSDMLSMYFALLQTNLEKYPSVNADWTKQSIELISSVSAQVQSHRTRSSVVVDRIGAQQEIDWFDSQLKMLQKTADTVLSLTSISRSSAAISDLESVALHIDTWINQENQSESKRAERRRGYDELQRTIALAKSAQVQAVLLYTKSREDSSTSLIYSQVQEKSIECFTHLLRGVAYAKEIIR